MHLIDVDDRATWPTEVRQWVETRASALAGTTEFTNDLGIPYEDDDEFTVLLAGHRILAYHFTRLLDHEADDIRANGLRVLTAAFVDSRIERGAIVGSITASEREVFRGVHVFASDEPWFARQRPYRENQTCFVIGGSVMVDDVSGVERLLSLWGGEALFVGAGEHLSRPAELGRPSIVVASLAPEAIVRTGPPLSKLFVGLKLGLHERHADVFYRDSLAGAHVIDVWHPGQPAYDRYRDLPGAEASGAALHP